MVKWLDELRPTCMLGPTLSLSPLLTAPGGKSMPDGVVNLKSIHPQTHSKDSLLPSWACDQLPEAESETVAATVGSTETATPPEKETEAKEEGEQRAWRAFTVCKHCPALRMANQASVCESRPHPYSTHLAQ